MRALVLIQGADDAAGVAHHEGSGDVLGDDSSCTDHGVLADGHAAQDDSSATDPYVVFNGDGRACFPVVGAVAGVERMGGGHKLYVATNQYGRADADRADVQEDGAEVEEGTVTDVGVHAVVKAYAGSDVGVFAQVAEVFTVDVHCLRLLAACVVFFGEDGGGINAFELCGAFGVGHVDGTVGHTVEVFTGGALRVCISGLLPEGRLAR